MFTLLWCVGSGERKEKEREEKCSIKRKKDQDSYSAPSLGYGSFSPHFASSLKTEKAALGQIYTFTIICRKEMLSNLGCI